MLFFPSLTFYVAEIHINDKLPVRKCLCVSTHVNIKGLIRVINVYFMILCDHNCTYCELCTRDGSIAFKASYHFSFLIYENTPGTVYVYRSSISDE